MYYLPGDIVTLSDGRQVKLFKNDDNIPYRSLTDEERQSLPYVKHSDSPSDQILSLTTEEKKNIVRIVSQKKKKEYEKYIKQKWSQDNTRNWDDLSEEEKKDYIDVRKNTYAFDGIVSYQESTVAVILDKYKSAKIWDSLPAEVKINELFYIFQGNPIALFTTNRKEWLEKLSVDNVRISVVNISTVYPDAYKEIKSRPKHSVTWMENRPEFYRYLNNLGKSPITNEQMNDIAHDKYDALILKENIDYGGLFIYNKFGSEKDDNEKKFSFYMNSRCSRKDGLIIYVVF